MNKEIKKELQADGLSEEAYQKQLDEYTVNGFFAGQSVRAFAPYINAGVLDEEAVIAGMSLKRRQIPMLTKELLAAGLLLESPVPTEIDLDSLDKPALLELAEKKNIQIKPRASIAEIVEAIRAGEGTPV